jgi:osmoprotectant transport system ATP-binding protein
MTAIVSFRDVSYHIGGREILRGLNLDVEEGETVVLLGRSGEGKTTTLRLVNGMAFPAQGQVLVEGKSTRAWNPIRLKRRIGYVIQEAGLFPHFTVAANVGLVPRLEGRPPETIELRVRELLEQVGLPAAEFASRYPHELSGGQRQRVGVARALAADPPLLLFDEPFGALDPVTCLELERQFLNWQRQFRKTSIFVTHDVREALLLGSRIGVLRKGRVEMLLTPQEFIASPDPEIQTLLATLEWRPRE